MCAREQGGDVEVDHPLPLVERRVHHRTEQHHAGVVHQGVEPPERGHHLLDGAGGLVTCGDVGGHDEDAGP